MEIDSPPPPLPEKDTSPPDPLAPIPALVLAGLLLLLPSSDASAARAPDSAAGRAESVVLFIGDGVDEHQLTLARNYLLGASGAFSFERFPHQAHARVLTVQEERPSEPEYVADSASSGTALAAGAVTSRGRIATRAKTGERVTTVLELARAAGMRTGIVTTSSITDATPASFVAHVRIRYCEGPKDMAGSMRGLFPGCPEDLRSAGGAGSIAEQLARSRVDVLLGGGLEHFDQANELGISLLHLATQQGYRILRSAEELASASPGQMILGLFGADTLPVEWSGEGGQSARPLERTASGGLVAPEPFRCVPNPARGARPSLEAMTRKALELLAGERGFFLMVESASIDKQAHAANPCGQIGETHALDRAVQVALEAQQDDPNLLIVVTSDHGHAAQIVPWPSLFDRLGHALGREMAPSGKVALLRTLEGGTMAVTYGTNRSYLEEHTGVAVPVYAQGPGAEQVRGRMLQSDVFFLTRDALGLAEAETGRSEAAARQEVRRPPARPIL